LSAGALLSCRMRAPASSGTKLTPEATKSRSVNALYSIMDRVVTVAQYTNQFVYKTIEWSFHPSSCRTRAPVSLGTNSRPAETRSERVVNVA